MGIVPIKKVNVGQMVFDQMQELLIRGEWKPGDRLPSENELAEMFKVSRITIRQALQKLSVLGLVETRFGEGSVVKTFDVGENMNGLVPMLYLDKSSNLQVFEFREMIETEAAGLAAMRATPDGIADLEKTFLEMQTAYEKGSHDVFARKDLEFHFKVCQMTENKLLIQTNIILKKILEVSMENVIDKMGCEPALYYHEKILQAIREKDKDAAMELMREHIRNNKKYYES